MKCHIFRMLVQKYHDGALDPAATAEYENHLRGCGACRRIDSQFAGVFGALEKMELYEPSADFNGNVMARVNVARYRVTPLKKALNLLGDFWEGLPSPVRVTGISAAVFALFTAIYTPFLYVMASAGKRLAELAGAGLYFARKTIDDPSLLVDYTGTVERYRVAGRVLFKTMQRQIAGMPLGHIGLTIIAMAVITYVAIRITRGAWKKGDTHAGVF